QLRVAVIAEGDGMSTRISEFVLKDRFFAAVVAVCTKHMLWFSRAFFFFQDVSKLSKTYLGQFVPLLFCVPCFYASNMFFKLAYTLQQRELLRLSSDCARLGGKDHRLEFDGLCLNDGGVAQRYQRLRYIASRLETANSRLDRS